MTLVQWTPFKGWQCAAPMPGGTKSKRSGEVKKRNAGREMSQWIPATDIIDTADSYLLKMEIPGMSKKDIKIEVKKDTLTIEGERKENDDKSIVYHRSERSNGTFSRSFRMPKNVDNKGIEAKLKNGILTLKIAKPEEQKPRNIPIQFN